MPHSRADDHYVEDSLTTLKTLQKTYGDDGDRTLAEPVVDAAQEMLSWAQQMLVAEPHGLKPALYAAEV